MLQGTITPSIYFPTQRQGSHQIQWRMALNKKLSEADVKAFHEDGVVCLRNVFSETWVQKAAIGIQKNLDNPSKEYRLVLELCNKSLGNLSLGNNY